MDKIDRAIVLGEDNEAALQKLYAEMRKRTGFKVLKGTQSINSMDFGTVKSEGCAAIIRFVGESVSVYYCGQKIADGSSPIICEIPRGNGQLKLNGSRLFCVALVIGPCK